MTLRLGCDCAGSRTLRGLGDAPSWWDNIVNSVSSEADNLWNDVEAAGVWAKDEVVQTWDDITNTTGGNNPVAAGYQAGQSDLQQYGTVSQAAGNVVGDLGQGIGNAIGSVGNALTTPVILVGGIILAAILLERK